MVLNPFVTDEPVAVIKLKFCNCAYAWNEYRLNPDKTKREANVEYDTGAKALPPDFFSGGIVRRF
ncbi:MAG: hypothetical protein LBG79_08800 [Spirochaetaceae bacterium]|jgi:hypothetical protein|nr:hypothetical protein [Spirochaetaceae bacterium]